MDFLVYLPVLSGIFLGMGLGGNDAANVFGPGVAAGLIRYRTATIITALFVIIGAYLQGPECMETFKQMSSHPDIPFAVLSSFSAAVVVFFFIRVGTPVSTSQAIMGSLIGVALARGQKVSWGLFFGKVVPAWVLTPLGGAVLGFLLYLILGNLVERWAKGAKLFDATVRLGIIVAGVYAAYSLGANNVANTTGVFYAAGMLSARLASLVGSLGIAIGVLFFSEKTMYTIGKRITALGPFSALVAVIAEAITVHFYTHIGVPVSTSQAMVGAIAGVGFVKGTKTVNTQVLKRIVIGWVTTPLYAGVFSFIATMIYRALFRC